MGKQTSTVNIDAEIHAEVKMLAQMDNKPITVVIEEQLRKLLQKRAADLDRMRKALGR